MKKTIIALVCLLLASSAAMAQKTFSFGPKIGVDYTHYWGKHTSHGGKLNYQAGLQMEYRFNGKFALAPEVVFAAQGGKYDYVNYDKTYPSQYGRYTRPANYHINYINLPVMFKYYMTPSLSIDFGPQVGFNVYHKVTIGQDPEGKVAKETMSLKEITHAVDFGLGLGLTYNFSDHVFVQARYTMGLTDVFKNIVFETEGETDFFKHHTKNGNAQISFGYRF